jgi:hypothetical protein
LIKALLQNIYNGIKTGYKLVSNNLCSNQQHDKLLLKEI